VRSASAATRAAVDPATTAIAIGTRSSAAEAVERAATAAVVRMAISVLAMRAAYGWRDRTAQAAAASTSP
jgi:hypothetical protein